MFDNNKYNVQLKPYDLKSIPNILFPKFINYYGNRYLIFFL